MKGENNVLHKSDDYLNVHNLNIDYHHIGKNAVHPHDERKRNGNVVDPWKIALLIAMILVFLIVLILIICILIKTTPPDRTTLAPTSDAPTTSTEIQVTTTEGPPINGWSEWSSWSACDVTCGQGYQLRARYCIGNETCKGPEEQAKECSFGFCTNNEIGSWNLWSGWTECSVDCNNGTQERTRECKHENGKDCPGPSTITRNCNTWECPDCDRVCPSGGSWYNCSYCSCPGQLINGTVRSIYGVGIPLIRIYDNAFPLNLLTETDWWGYFKIPDGCLGINLLFEPDEKNDYNVVQQVVTTTSMEMTVTMQEKKNLKITKKPENKVRLVNESAMICCEANGVPPVEYFQWQIDGVFIMRESAKGNRSVLDLEDLLFDDTGYYSCEAINDEYTHTVYAEILVKATREDFCQTIPQSKIEHLPLGCSFNGQTSIDIGRCGENSCYTPLLDALDCEDTVKSCCRMVEYDRIKVQCQGFELEYSLITKCGCVLGCS